MNEQLVETGRNFLTKLWNVVRFAQMNGCVYNEEFRIENVSSPVAKWIVHQVKEMIIVVENSMNNYRVDEVSRHIYHCVWDSFCDWYMEFIKPTLQHDEKQGGDLQLTILRKDFRDTTAWAIIQFLRVLYPICPFIVKKLGEEMGIIDTSWPNADVIELDFSDAIKEVEALKTIISSIRSIKQCLRIPLGEKINANIEGYAPHIKDIISNHGEVLNRMAGITLGETSAQTIPVVVDGAIIHLEVGGKINVDTEQKRLLDELSKLKTNRDAALQRLSNNDFLSKAMPDVIEEHEKRVTIFNEKIQKIECVIKSLEVV
jgi:valyl-tRNA synthetase